MKRIFGVPHKYQNRDYTCGPVVIEMMLNYLGIEEHRKDLVKELRTTKRFGTHNSDFAQLIKKRGLYYVVKKNSNIKTIKKFVDSDIPVIVNYKEPSEEAPHFGIVVGYTKDRLILNDPHPKNGRGFKINIAEFEKRWFGEKPPVKRWLIAISDKKIKA